MELKYTISYLSQVFVEITNLRCLLANCIDMDTPMRSYHATRGRFIAERALELVSTAHHSAQIEVNRG